MTLDLDTEKGFSHSYLAVTYRHPLQIDIKGKSMLSKLSDHTLLGLSVVPMLATQ